MEERNYQAQLEQERQDHELALRLAEESNGQLEESPPMSRKYVKTFVTQIICFLYIKNMFKGININLHKY